jgi:2-dehydro-3-deoxy-D-arabinonate dehydratase
MTVLRYRTADGSVHIGVERDGSVLRLPVSNLAELLAGDLGRFAAIVAAGGRPESDPVRPLAPVDGDTEVWAAGVTYRRSMQARMEESREADVYDRVYAARRPELFFKSTAWRVRGPGEPVAIREDSTVDVPEPELALVLTASGEIAGYTICNDMSSRDIEGENPLYLPQAKVYTGSCALGPGIALATEVSDPGGLVVEIEVRREGALAWWGRADTGTIVRPLPELAAWLFAELDFPAGAVLATGTGIVPDLGFSLEPGDDIEIRIDGLGRLTNPVVRGKRAALATPADPALSP